MDIATAFLSEYRGYLDARKVRVVAVAGQERSVFFPQVATFDEALSTDALVRLAWRFRAVPEGVQANRLRFLEVSLSPSTNGRRPPLPVP